MGPLGKWASIAEGVFCFSKIQGIIQGMKFNEKQLVGWRPMTI